MGVDTDGFLPSGKGRRPPEPCCVWKLVICWLPRGSNSGSPCTIDNNKNKNNTSSWWQPFIFRLDFLFSSRFPSSLTTFHSGIHHFVAWFLVTGLFSFDTIKLKISFTEKNRAGVWLAWRTLQYWGLETFSSANSAETLRLSNATAALRRAAADWVQWPFCWAE